MLLERHAVELVNQAGHAARGVFVVTEDDGVERCRLTLQYRDVEITAVAHDYFEAMCRIRRRLEQAGWFPLCYGASRQVYPSGMARDMGRGLKAYKLRLRCRPGMEDLVGIFDAGPDVELATVLEQKEFFDRWWKSPK
jgi:hypothetical protein